MNDRARRFSLRQGIEAEPEQPILEDAPKRLRFFVLQFLKNNFYDHVAVELVARVLCQPALLTSNLRNPDVWANIQPRIDQCEWWEIYNLLEGIYVELPSMSSGTQPHFVESLNRVLSEESIAWKMDAQGHLQRLLPAPIQAEIEILFQELQAPKWSTALDHFKTARAAYNARPRRDR